MKKMRPLFFEASKFYRAYIAHTHTHPSTRHQHTYIENTRAGTNDRISMDSGLTCGATIKFVVMLSCIHTIIRTNTHPKCRASVLLLLPVLNSKVLSISVLSASAYIHRTHFTLRILASFFINDGRLFVRLSIHIYIYLSAYIHTVSVYVCQINFSCSQTERQRNLISIGRSLRKRAILD